MFKLYLHTEFHSVAVKRKVQCKFRAGIMLFILTKNNLH